ncbi:MAG: hypothetical protein ACM3S1_09300 [Hyphomicrobiales bacterium]
MTTLPELRDRVRQDLHDTDSSAYRWPDSQLDRHIERALGEVSLAIPQELTATLATTSGSRELSLAALDGLLEVEAVEYPVGHFPPCYVGFATWAATLTLHSATEPDGSDAKLYYTARHTLDEAGSSLPDELVDLVAMGAGAYAALEQAVATTGVLVTGDRVPDRFAEWGRARLTAFHQLLHHYGRRNRVRARRLYTPA